MKKVIRLRSCAKINLGLSILSKRNDGYHNVDMVMQTLDLYDFITLEKNECLEVRVSCNKELNCRAENNIAYKAAKKFLEHVGVDNFFVDIDIEKNIPICAGLAGGSSNAAAVLVGLNNMMETNLSISELVLIGKEIGADVPFCIIGGTMRATGTGTNLEKVRGHLKYYVLIVKPKIGISTKDAYEKIDLCRGLYRNEKMDNILIGIEKNDTRFIAKNLFNDLEKSLSGAQKVEIDCIKKILVSMGALNACMSGSGPSVYGIFDDEIVAYRCLEKIRGDYEESFLCSPVDYGVKIL